MSGERIKVTYTTEVDYQMNYTILDYIKELEIRLLHVGEELPAMREDINHFLKYEEE